MIGFCLRGHVRVSCVLALSLVVWLAAGREVQASDEPEEPDYFFLTGGPYTQRRNSPQVIWGNQWFWTSAGGLRTRDYTGAGRFEWGLTNRWEADFEFGALQLRERVNGVTMFSESGSADLLFGVRYRLLDESFAPFSLTLGPQVIAPVASRRRGLGSGEVGYAWDLAAAKDWGGPVFLAASINAALTPGVSAFPDGTGREVDLTEVVWSAALGLRAVERSTVNGTHHDIHVFIEISSTRVEEVESGERTRTTQGLLAPGLRYGFLSRGGSLTEIGASFPIGLNNEAPDWGFILQFQFEIPGSE
ncbi:hypothetical protein MYX75_06595 [Acidobacteria bacterium AH-259-A15]|nr:hypothetical protein [Acidobacteria bacterium AH-259-A15]